MSEIVAGLDWAKDAHRVCVLDGAGACLAERDFDHTEAGLADLCASLAEHGVARVALERPEGLLVGVLLEAGAEVVPMHPNQVKAARARFRAAGKSDGFDAYVLAELCRTDAHRFSILRPDADETVALRALSRARADLVGHRVALANQLRQSSSASGPERRRSSARSTRRSPWPSWSAIRPPLTPAGWAGVAWPVFSPATDPAAGAARPSCLAACRMRRPGAPGPPRPRRAGRSSSGWWRPWVRW